MSQRTAFITGANGAIGQALCTAFHDAGWRVIASDLAEIAEPFVDAYISMDLKRLCHDSVYRDKIFTLLRVELQDGGMHVLINNAAIQCISPVEQLSIDDLCATLDVNLVAPFVLIKAFLSELKKAEGSVINIASIHAQLTKPHFTAYATSKAALVGMTRSLAVELGDRVRINAICPAAIATPMLVAGFANNPQGLADLEKYHPSCQIGAPEELASLALYLANGTKFMNGMVVGLDGGIASRLHDPD